MRIDEVISDAELVVGPALEHTFAADTETRKEFHEIGIAVGNAQAPEKTDAFIGTFFRLVEILIKVIVDVPRTFLVLEFGDHGPR